MNVRAQYERALGAAIDELKRMHAEDLKIIERNERMLAALRGNGELANVTRQQAMDLARRSG